MCTQQFYTNYDCSTLDGYIGNIHDNGTCELICFLHVYCYSFAFLRDYLRESRSQPMLTSTPVSTDSKILEHFDQMRTLISGFLPQKSDGPPFLDYVASEAEKITQEEFEDLKGRIFRDIEAVKNTHGRQPLPKRSTTLTRESQKVGILPTTTQQASSSTQAAAGSSFKQLRLLHTQPHWLWKPSISVHITGQGQQTRL